MRRLRKLGKAARTIAMAAAVTVAVGSAGARLTLAGDHDSDAETTTPIEHVVVIFQENVSFDHYFATYPHALNPAGEPKFTAWAKNPPPAVNGLMSGGLLMHNPNSAQPFRLDRRQAATCDMD